MSLMDVPADASPTPISMNEPAFGQATTYRVFQVFVQSRFLRQGKNLSLAK